MKLLKVARYLSQKYGQDSEQVNTYEDHLGDYQGNERSFLDNYQEEFISTSANFSNLYENLSSIRNRIEEDFGPQSAEAKQAKAVLKVFMEAFRESKKLREML